MRNVTGSYGSAKKRAQVNIPGGSSVMPRQRVESTHSWANLPGGSAPGGTVGVPMSTQQVMAAKPTSRPNANDLPAHQHGVHQATFRRLLTADPSIVGVPLAPNGRSRGQSPLVLRQTRAPYRN